MKLCKEVLIESAEQAEQARADGDPGRANLHDWAADQAQHFQKEQTR